MISRFFVVLLALGVAISSRPAGGFVLREQRSGGQTEVPLQIQRNTTEVIIDLSGEWQWRIAREDVWHSGWIPSCFSEYQGEVVFQKEIFLPDSLRGWHFHLVINQANFKVNLVINGKSVESVQGNHLGFTFDLPTQLLRYKEPNIFELRVDNRLNSKTTLPLFPKIYAPRNDGGILSECYLWITPPWAIEEAVLNWPVADSTIGATVAVDVSLAFVRAAPFSEPFANISCVGEISNEEGVLIAKSSITTISVDETQSQQVILEFPPFEPQTWTPDNPILYNLDVRLETSQGLLHLYRRQVGFKEITIVGHQFRLNGEPLSLHGTQYVPEDIETGAAIAEDVFKSDVRRMKELGFNVVHVIPSPPPPKLLEVCDRLGMLVFAGLPLDGIPADLLARPAYRKQCGYALKRLVHRDRTHVCIAAWGLGHDLDWRRQQTLEVVSELAHRLQAMDRNPTFIETYRLYEVAHYPVDFFLLGLAPWRRDFPLDPEATTKPVILSRIGMMVTETGGGKGQGSSTEQADFLLTQVMELSRNSNFAGSLLFTFSDYSGQMPLLAQDDKENAFIYSFGLLDRERRERVSFFRLQEFAQTGESSPMSQEASGKPLPIGFPIGGLVLIILLSFEVRRNKVFKQNLKRVFLHAHGFFSDIHNRRFLQSSQTFILTLIQAVCWTLLGSSFFYGLRYSYRFDYVLTHFLRWPDVKLSILGLVWDPIVGAVYLVPLFLFLFFLFALVIKLASFTFRKQVSLGKAMTYLSWSGANFIFLLPFTVIFYRLVNIKGMVFPCVLILFIFIIWFGLRLSNALRIAYETSYLRLYLTAFCGGGAFVLIFAFLLQASIGTISYWSYYWSVVAH